MALIVCPSCGKSVSDQAETCVHCGADLREKPVMAAEENCRQEDSIPTCRDCGGALYDSSATVCPYCGCPITSDDTKASREKSSLARGEGKNKIAKIGVAVAAVVAVIAIVAVCIVQGVQAKQAADEAASFNEYVSNVETVSSKMLTGAADAETVCGKVSSISSSAIFDERSEWDSDIEKYYSDDFNEAISNYYADSSTVSLLGSIKSNQSEVSSLMAKLNNPPDEAKTAYGTLNDLYDDYLKMTGLAESPTGSLQTFNSSFNSADEGFLNTYKKLQSQIPEKK